MDVRAELQALIGATDDEMAKLLKNNAPDEIVKRTLELCRAIQAAKPAAVFGITPNYVMISVPPGTRGTKVVELLPKLDNVVVNVMKLPSKAEYQVGRPQYFRDLKDENGNPRINWYRLDYNRPELFETMKGAILDVYEQKLK